MKAEGNSKAAGIRRTGLGSGGSSLTSSFIRSARAFFRAACSSVNGRGGISFLEKRMENLIQLTEQHHWQRNAFRTNVADPTHLRTDRSGRQWVRNDVAPFSNTLREGPILECVQQMLPHVNAVCLNRTRATSPPMTRHRDRKNEGGSHICLWRDFEGGGELCLEDGTVFSERGVWHHYDGAKLEQWVQTISGNCIKGFPR